MAEQEIDINFGPADYLVPERFFIDRTFWEHIDEHMSVPSSKNCPRFYVPQTRARKGWTEKLKVRFGVEPFIEYDPAVLNLPNEITAEEIEAFRKDMNKYLVESLENPVPVPPPEKVSVQEYLRHKSTSLTARLCFADDDERAKRIWNSFSEKEKRIYRWTEDYGFLWDHRDGKGMLFPAPKDDSALKFETTCEYFFQVPSFPQLILSLGCEPNTERAIYGLRREASLDWPFDKIWLGPGVDENGKPKAKMASIPDETVRRQIVEPMNSLIRNIEYLISR